MSVLVEIPTEGLVSEIIGKLPNLEEIVAAVIAALPPVSMGPAPSGGSNDDEAINQAIVQRKGRVLLHPGVYRVSRPIELLDGQGLWGVGNGERTDSALANLSIGTRIEAADGFVGPAIVVAARPDGRRPLAGVTIRDLSIDGRGIGFGINGLFFSSHRGLVSNVNISRCSGHGLVTQGVAADPSLIPPRPQWQTYDTRYEGIRSHDNGGHGILFGPHSPDSQSDDLMAFRNGGDGIRLQSSSKQIGRVHCYSNGENGLHYDNAGSRGQVAEAKLEQNGRSGLYVNGANGGIMFLSFGMVEMKNNGGPIAGRYDQLHINGNPGAVTGTYFGRLCVADITGEGGQTKMARYAVNIANSYARDTHIASLHVENSAYLLAAMRDEGLRTLVALKRVT